MNLVPDTPPKGTVRSWLDARAEAGGTAFVFCETTESLSWREVREAALGLAGYLTTLGIEKGESIAIMHPNGRDGLIALYAVLCGGFRATMINLAAGSDAISYALEHSEARFAFVHADHMEAFKAVAPQSIAVLDDGARSDTDLHPLEPADHALLMYTSGTTGRPKGVVHTHASLLAGGWTTATAHQLTPQDRGFCVLPIYHINGLCVTVLGTLVSGGSLAIFSRFSASNFWDQAGAAKITWFSVVPTIVSHLLHNPSEPDDATKARIRFGRSASSALAVETQTAFEARFGVPIIETMGLTETAAQILSNPLPPGQRKIGSPGMAFGNEVRILASDLTECDPDIEGEIAVRGPNVMLEYLKNPQATAATFAGDWLRTGDLGRIDKDGYVFVTGRLKELIIKGGENIAPREIDEALYGHPDVVEAAAFARPCKTYGETVEAAVRLREGSSVVATELIEACVLRVGKFKSPDQVHFMAELPKGPSGKIQRLKLADILG
ncbi:MAG: AMP-binding protein [Silicimonas sp.]|nr:AMP-binding protein [Silicimonas sp.]